MSKTAYLIIAISILIVLLVVFIISFIAYRRTPVPKGCEGMKINEKNCEGCSHSECSFYKEMNKEEDE